MNRLTLPLCLGALALAAAPAAAQPAAAEPAAATLELPTFVVTAQKREQILQEVPITMTAYSGDFLASLNVRELAEAAPFIPGLQIQQQSVNNPGFVIRGITSDSGEAWVEPRVSVFQDGVSISKSRGSVVELFDLERIEVLKGPQGTLFGRGAQIGAVHIVSAKPVQAFAATLVGGLGSEGEYLAEGMVNFAVTDAVAVRVAAIHKQRDGFKENLSGGDLNGTEKTAARASVRWQATDTAVLDVVLNWQHDDAPGISFKSGNIPTRGDIAELAAGQSLSVSPYDAADLERGEGLYVDRTVWSLAATGAVELSPEWDATAIVAWREYDSYESFDADGSQLPALWFAEDAQGEQFSAELRFNYDNGGDFAAFAGVSFFHEDGSRGVPFETDERAFYALVLPGLQQQLIGLGVPAAQVPFILPTVPVLNADGTPNLSTTALPATLALLAPNPLAGLANAPLKPFHSETFTEYGSTKAYEAFVDGSYKVGDKLELTAGLRVTYEDVESGFEVVNSAIPSALSFITSSAPNILSAPTNGRLTASDNFTSAVGRLVGRYQVTDNVNTYLTVSRGRRPNVIEWRQVVTVPFAASTWQPEVLNEETVTNIEWGWKGSTFEHRLQWEVAVFNQTYENFQTDVGEALELPQTIDAGSASGYGFEASLIALVAKGVQVFGSYNYLRFEFDEFDTDGNPQDYAGNQFRLTPRNSFSLGVNANFTVGGVELFVTPTYTWKSQIFFEEENQPAAATALGLTLDQEDYGLLNLRVGTRFGTDHRWEISAYCTNALDEEYLIDAGNTGLLFGTPTFIQGAPRFFGAQVKFLY